MGVFKYETIDLEGPAFRLLRLFKGRESEIECELCQAWLHDDSAISYEALSYIWGGTEMSERIKINGRTLSITENLYLALQYLRLQDTDRILWVDAICINQSNEKERGHQVQQMGNIYSQADRVILWLGPATYDTNVLMDSLKRLQEESIKHACKDWKLADKRWMDLWLSVQPTLRSQHPGLVTRQREGMECLLGRPWFKRVWILQEVANAKAAVVCSGTRSISARIFALAPLLIGAKPEPHCQAVLDIMPGSSRKESWWSQKRDLYTLLLKFRESKATDQRDIIYALLGISSDARDTDNLRADYTKTVQQVVHNATLFLFGLTDFPYHTMAEFICNFTSLNTIHLSRVATSCNVNTIADFLEQRGDDVNITEEVVKAAAGNVESGKEVMVFLLEQRAEEVLIAAARSGKEVMAVLLKQGGAKVKITEEVVKAAVRSGGKVMAVLLKQGGAKVSITEGVVKAAVRSGGEVIAVLLEQRAEEVLIAAARSGKEVMAVLLKQKRVKVKITEEVVKAAVGNSCSGDKVIGLLLEQRGEEVNITEEVLIAAAQSGKEVMAVLLEQRAEEVLIAAARSGKEVMGVLLKQGGAKVKITEEVVKAAVGNSCSGNEREVNITEEVLIAAAWSGKEVMAVLLKQGGAKVRITEEVVKAAVGNSCMGNEVIGLLLEQRGEEVNITEEVLIAAARSGKEVDGGSSKAEEEPRLRLRKRVVKAAVRSRKEVTALLLEQRAEEVLIAAARSGKEVIALLLEQRAEEVLIAAARSGREVMGVLLKQGGAKVKITEEVLIAAVQSGKEVMAVLLEQGAKVKITEKVVKAAVRSGGEVMTVLLEQRAEEVLIAAAQSGREVIAVLLKQRGAKVKITEEVVKAVVGNSCSGNKVIGLLLKQQGEEVNITEEVLITAARSGKEVMAVLLKQERAKVKITEEVVKAAMENY
ncbi:HET-domain-containing protein, partial [Cenococcum geophilum 1.58]|uniref:HET-domain-containing protein n=1 Tax=Cenococcum geophilum 1.58 TaxID=794803 RepID=UPI00358F3969